MSLDQQLLPAAREGDYKQVIELICQIRNLDDYFLDFYGIHDDFLGALKFSAMCGYTEVVQFLITTPEADIDENLNQSLYGAASNGHVDIVRLLVEKEAKKYHFTLEMTSVSEMDEVIGLFQNPPKGAKKYHFALTMASVKGMDEVIDLFLNPQKYQLNIPASSIKAKDSALINAICNGRFSTAHLLIENGADIHRAYQKSGQDLYRSIAHSMGSIGDRAQMAHLLLHPQKYGLDMDAWDRNVLVRNHSKILTQIQQLEQEELYDQARVMFYALSFAKQGEYSRSDCGALIQAFLFH